MWAKQMAYAGGDLNLANTPVAWVDETDVGDLIVLRQCAKNVIFTFANSNAMNGEVIGYKLAYWAILVIVIDCVIAAAIVIWGFFAIFTTLRAANKKSSEPTADKQ